MFSFLAPCRLLFFCFICFGLFASLIETILIRRIDIHTIMCQKHVLRYRCGTVEPALLATTWISRFHWDDRGHRIGSHRFGFALISSITLKSNVQWHMVRCAFHYFGDGRSDTVSKGDEPQPYDRIEQSGMRVFLLLLLIKLKSLKLNQSLGPHTHEYNMLAHTACVVICLCEFFACTKHNATNANFQLQPSIEVVHFFFF